VEKKQEEAQALSRWYQLLCSIVTRQRLKDSYKTPSHGIGNEGLPENDNVQRSTLSSRSSEREPSSSKLQTDHDHDHEFPKEDQSFDEETFVRTKRCPCGFSIQVEEL
jgi:xeroderma pigmentosum group C-complementing protein